MRLAILREKRAALRSYENAVPAKPHRDASEVKKVSARQTRHVVSELLHTQGAVTRGHLAVGSALAPFVGAPRVVHLNGLYSGILAPWGQLGGLHALVESLAIQPAQYSLICNLHSTRVHTVANIHNVVEKSQVRGTARLAL